MYWDRMSLVSAASLHDAELPVSADDGGWHLGLAEWEVVAAGKREVEDTCVLTVESVPHARGRRCVLCYPTVHSRRCSAELDSNELPRPQGMNGSEGEYTLAASR